MPYSCDTGCAWYDVVCKAWQLSYCNTSQPVGQCPAGYYFDPTAAECLLAESGIPIIYTPTTPVVPPTSSCAERCDEEWMDQTDSCYAYCFGEYQTPYTPPAPSTSIAPNCTFDISHATAKVGETVTFTPYCTAGDLPMTFEWNFRDGSSVATGGWTKTHIFSKSGTYYPILTVSNAWHIVTVGGVPITITATPVPPPVIPPVTTLCSPSNCASPKTCVGGYCTAPSAVCSPSNCASPKTCVGGYCTAPDGGGGGGAAKVSCVGLNRGGNLDPTCVLEKGNEKYLYAAAGLIVILLLMKKK